jgi:hypothetical protein
VIVRRQLKRRQVIAFSAMPGWHRGVRLISLLVARAPSPWSQGAADATGLREALRQATEERYGRC